MSLKTVFKDKFATNCSYAFLYFLLQNAAFAAEPAGTTDAASGLVIAQNWELARAHCGACHSYKLVTSQRGDRTYWLNTIRWMQRTQNLWQLPAEQEELLLRYLSSNYNETEWGRRPALSPQMLPGAAQ